jgi:hypothetical protein
MAKPPARSASEANLLLAVLILTVVSGVTALSCALTSSFVLDQLHNTEALALIVVDGSSIKSDSADLERNLSWATLALKSVRDLGWALAVGCSGVGVAVFIRSRRQNAS